MKFTLGWLSERDGATRRLPDGKLMLRGEWSSFALIFAIIAVRYVIAVVGAVNPVLNADPIWHMATLFVSSGLTAFFLGRIAARLRVYLTSAPVAA